MKPYSNDFRQKIVQTHHQEQTSILQTAKRFNVSYSFVWKLLHRHEQTGAVAPHPHGGGQKPKLKAEHFALLVQLVEQHNDATLEQLCERLYVQTQVRISRATMGRWVLHLELTRKKRRSTQMKRTVSASKV
jgi:transposase